MIDIVNAIKLAPRYLAAIGTFSGLLLFLPKNLADTIGVSHLAQDYRQWLGLAFLASLALLAVHWSIEIGAIIRNATLVKEHQKMITQKLHTLTENEKQILRFYIATQSKTNRLRIDDGIVGGLVASGVIYRATSVGNMVDGFDHNISEFAWEYLHKHQGLLAGTTDTRLTHQRRDRYF